jgi:hypothetical protein
VSEAVGDVEGRRRRLRHSLTHFVPSHSYVIAPQRRRTRRFRLVILFAIETLYLSIMPKYNSKGKKKASTVNAAAAKFGGKMRSLRSWDLFAVTRPL